MSGPSDERYGELQPIDATSAAALDRRIGRRVCLRVGPVDPAGHEAFLREARVLAQLQHPAIPRVHDLGVRQGRPYYTLDLLAEGCPLESEVPEERGAGIRALVEVAAALEHAHGRGVLHGSLGPADVLLGDLGRVWVTGWERALPLPNASEEVRAVGGLVAPPEPCTAPELARGAAPDPRADVWGLGLVLEQVLQAGEPQAGLAAITARALARSPSARYARPEELAEDLRRWLDHRAVAGESEGLVAGLLRLARRHPGIATVVAITLIVLATSGVIAGVVIARELERLRAGELRARESLERAERDRGAAELLEREVRTEVDPGRVQLLFELALLRSEARRDVALREAEEHALGAPEPVRAALLLRIHQTRGWIHLERGRPGEALAALAEAGAGDEVLFARLLATSRLAGDAARKQEKELRAALRARDSDVGALVRLEAGVAEAERLAARGEEPAASHKAAPALEALVPLSERIGERYRAHALTVQGRAWTCWLGPDSSRFELKLPARALAIPSPPRTVEEAMQLELVSYRRAIGIDPVAPLPRARLARQASVRLRGVAPWDPQGVVIWRDLVRAVELTPRPELLLDLAQQLQKDGRVFESWPWLQRCAEEITAQGEDHGLKAHDEVRMRLLRTRLLLTNQMLPLPHDLAPHPALGPLVERERRGLLGWKELVSNGGGEALLRERVAEVEPAWRRFDQEDLVAAFADPRADPRQCESIAAAFPEPWKTTAVALAQARQGTLPERTASLLVSQMHSSGSGELRIGVELARSLSERPARAVSSHLLAFMVWASLNLCGRPTTVEAIAAQKVIAARLERAGERELAQRLRALDPVEELWPQRRHEPACLRLTSTPGKPR